MMLMSNWVQVLLSYRLQICHEDIRWEGEDPGITYRGGFGGQGRGIKRPFGRGGHIPGSMKGRGSSRDQGQFRKEFTETQNRLEKVSDCIELLNTETLVKEVCTGIAELIHWCIIVSVFSRLLSNLFQVERLFDISHPDPLELVKAKKMLKVRSMFYANQSFDYLSLLGITSFSIVWFICRSMSRPWLMPFQDLQMHLMVKVVINVYIIVSFAYSNLLLLVSCNLKWLSMHITIYAPIV